MASAEMGPLVGRGTGAEGKTESGGDRGIRIPGRAIELTRIDFGFRGSIIRQQGSRGPFQEIGRTVSITGGTWGSPLWLVWRRSSGIPKRLPR